MANITLKGSPIHTNGALPKVGASAPDFTLIDQNLKECSLRDYQGKKLILSLVPSLDTSVCLLSAKKFNEALLTRQDLKVLYISADLPFAQKRVCGLEKLEHIETLSMMRDRKFAEDYGMLIVDGPLQGLCARAIVALDAAHQILYTELVPEVTQEPNYDQVLTTFS